MWELKRHPIEKKSFVKEKKIIQYQRDLYSGEIEKENKIKRETER